MGFVDKIGMQMSFAESTRCYMKRCKRSFTYWIWSYKICAKYSSRKQDRSLSLTDFRLNLICQILEEFGTVRDSPKGGTYQL
jgi:hypothetical protein